MVPLGAAMLTSSTPGLVFTNAVLGFCFTFILKIAHVVLVLSVIMFGVSLMDVLSRSSSNFAVAEERTMEQCSICWVQMTKTNAVKLGCNHYFHQQCAERWHLINPTCALCRYKI